LSAFIEKIIETAGYTNCRRIANTTLFSRYPLTNTVGRHYAPGGNNEKYPGVRVGQPIAAKGWGMQGWGMHASTEDKALSFQKLGFEIIDNTNIPDNPANRFFYGYVVVAVCFAIQVVGWEFTTVSGHSFPHSFMNSDGAGSPWPALVR
jgi:hypothetical protein